MWFLDFHQPQIFQFAHSPLYNSIPMLHWILPLFLYIHSCQSQSFPTLQQITLPTSDPCLLIRYASNNAFIATVNSIYVYNIPSQTFTNSIGVAFLTMMDVATDGKTVVVTTGQNSPMTLATYVWVNDSFVKTNETQVVSSLVSRLKISDDKKRVLVGVQDSGRLYADSGNGYFQLAQNLSSTNPVQSTQFSSDSQTLVFSSKSKIFHFTYSSVSSNYILFDSFSPDTNTVTTEGVMDMSKDGNVLAYRGDQTTMYIRRKLSTTFFTVQNLPFLQVIRRIRISSDSWLIAAVVGDQSLRLYANISGSFSVASTLTSSKYIQDIDISPDSNYLLGAHNSNTFQIWISSKLSQKAMFSNAPAVLLSTTMATALAITVGYFIITKKGPSKVDVEKEEVREVEDTQVQIVRNPQPEQ